MGIFFEYPLNTTDRYLNKFEFIFPNHPPELLSVRTSKIYFKAIIKDVKIESLGTHKI